MTLNPLLSTLSKPICDYMNLIEHDTCTAVFSDCQQVIYLHKEGNDGRRFNAIVKHNVEIAEICVESLEYGQCTGRFPRFYFDASINRCRRFIYSGCKGNRNNFMVRRLVAPDEIWTCDFRLYKHKCYLLHKIFIVSCSEPRRMWKCLYERQSWAHYCTWTR